MSAGRDRIDALPDLTSDFLCRLSRLLETHAAQTHLTPLSVSVVDERPPASTRSVNDQVKPVTVGVVARLLDRLDFSSRQPSRSPAIFALRYTLRNDVDYSGRPRTKIDGGS